MMARSSSTVQRREVIEWSVASRALPGESVSGDLHVVVPTAEGVLISVVDGLGHGEDAVAAARVAAAILEERAEEPVVALVQHCHRALQRTRGVVMTIVSVNASDNTATALGIGNVETAFVRADPRARTRRESVLLRCGVVGYQLPALHASVLPVATGDMIVFATDGVWEDFSELVNPVEAPAQLVEKILAQKFRGTDDGLVLACKYFGRS
jgi:serine phosphatase RsbU (regulator of sigma subunit)